MFTDDEIKVRLILKLYKHGKWGASHTSFGNLKKGFANRDLGKQGTKRVDKIGKEMIRSGFLLSKPTAYGLEVSLNPKMSHDMMSTLRRAFPDVS